MTTITMPATTTIEELKTVVSKILKDAGYRPMSAEPFVQIAPIGLVMQSSYDTLGPGTFNAAAFSANARQNQDGTWLVYTTGQPKRK